MSFDFYAKVKDALDRGGSETGVSYWTDMARCARHARLSAELQQQRRDLGAFAHLPPKRDKYGKPKLNALIVGTVYHVLQEYADEAVFSPWSVTDPGYTPEFAEAVRLWRAYHNSFGSPAKKWEMEFMEVEEALPKPGFEKKVIALYGHMVTGRLDARGIIMDTDKVQSKFEIQLDGPGLYLLDHKTDSQEMEENEWKYIYSLQACNYILLWNLCHPDTPCKGMITDVVYKRAAPGFGHFFTPAASCDPGRIRNLVEVGVAARKADMCNPTGCSNHISFCQHYKSGRCPGY